MADDLAFSGDDTVDFPEKLSVLFEPARYKVIYGGRGKGATWGMCRALVLLAATKPLRVVCGREMQKSIQESVHKTLATQIDLLGLNWCYDVLQTRIVGKHATPAQGSEFIFVGLRHNVSSIKSMEAIDVFYAEEANNISKHSWDQVLPTVRRDPPFGPFGQGSEIWVGFNPDLEDDDTYQRFVMTPPAGAKLVEMTYRDNPWFPQILREQMEECRDNRPDDYLNIWEGKCRRWLDAAIYAAELRDLEMGNRVTDVPHRPGIPVSVFCDLGYADFTVMWFIQKVGMNYHIIDFMKNQLKFWPFYLKALQSKPYVYDAIWLPHDGSHHDISQVDANKTVEGQTRAAGLTVRRVPDIAVNAGINAVRTVFPALYFDRKACADGLNDLRRYRYGVRKSGETQSHTREPLHDDASHTADALRYLAVGLKEGEAIKTMKLPKPKFRPQGSQGWMA